MKAIDAIEIVLEEAGKPLHYKEITRRILDKGLWQTSGLTPEATVSARIAVNINEFGQLSRFQRVEPGTYALRKWGMTDYVSQRNEDSEKDEQPHYSFTDAAEMILEEIADKRPMHYRDITDKILDAHLVVTEGKTPEATLYSQIITEIKRQEKNKKTPRFVQYGAGMVGLRKWMGEGLAFQIEKHNRDIRKKLQAYLLTISPTDFEELIGSLLAEMGFEEIEVTNPSNDRGIDVRGTLVVGNAVRTRMAIQAKRWSNNIGSPIVQQVRGSLGTHEQGMIITTSGFSTGAIREADRADAIPVALVNGEKLIELLVDHELLVKHTQVSLLNLDIDSLDE